MFDQTERRFFATPHVEHLMPPIQDALYRSYGAMLVQTGPSQWVGRGNSASYSMFPKIIVNADRLGDGISLEVRVLADLDGGGVAVIVLCYLFCLPLGLVLGLLGYQDFKSRREAILAAAFYPVHHLQAAPNFAPALQPYR